MNLLDKKLGLGAVLMALILFSSCEEAGNFGLGDDDVSPVDFFSENIPITSQVLLIDSIPSDDGETLLVGSVNNSDFGTSVARSFSVVNLNKETLVDLLPDAVLDSAKMNLKFNYIHNTEKTVLDLQIGELTQGSIFDSLSYFTKSESPRVVTNILTGEPIVIAEQIIEVENLDSTYIIDMDPVWALELFNLLRDNDPRVADQESFREQFLPGIAFIGGPFTTGAFGIETVVGGDGETSVASNIVLYFHQTAPNGTGDINFTLIMTFNDAKHFFTLETDRTGSDTEIVQDFGTAYEPATDMRYIQEGNGIVTKIDVSGLRDFTEARPDVVVNFAQLTIGPLESRPTINGEPPQELILYLTDDRNTLIPDGNAFRGIQRDGGNQIASSATITLDYDAETNSYSGSVSSFVQSYHAEIFQRDEWVLFTGNMNTSLNGMVLDPNNIELKIFFSELK